MAQLGNTPMFDAGANPPRVIKQKVGAKIVEHKIPNGTVQRWVDAAGNVVHLQISDGSVRTRNSREYRIAMMRNGGGIPYGDCPLRSGDLKVGEVPEGMRMICADGTYGEEKACQHVEWVIQERRKDHDEKQKTRIAKSAVEIEREQREREIEVMREGMAKVVGALAANAQQGKPK